jgi:hypothetical protein
MKCFLMAIKNIAADMIYVNLPFLIYIIYFNELFYALYAADSFLNN